MTSTQKTFLTALSLCAVLIIYTADNSTITNETSVIFYSEDQTEKWEILTINGTHNINNQIRITTTNENGDPEIYIMNNDD